MIVRGVHGSCLRPAPRRTADLQWVTRDTTLHQVQGCVRDLAAPQSGDTAQIDIWNSVLDCLSAGWTPGEGDGGFDNDVVNGCLEDQGVL